ncbi:hypothetical protein [Streptomyces sp. GS7]|uniref:hypothetical protein n=1 Tax=Streptomyces sp. GS7 TaxID=2692234 RepID=UPI001316F84F|nr:hypothetical protein [Streptomyces sp. GS7]QHC22208.1 hypothetical protein GR130_12975 [Streptomyces sp. GS7]
MRAAVSGMMLGLAVAALVTAVPTAASAQERSDRVTATVPLMGNAKGTFTATAKCPRGKTVTGGGFVSRGQDANGSITESYPDTPTSWKVTINDPGMGNRASVPHVVGTVYALCSR